MNAQLEMFIAAVVCGVLALLLWDIFHGLRKTFFRSVAFNVLLDCLWWAAVGFGFVYCMWIYGSMRLRFFVFLGVGAGAVLYRFTLSDVVRRCFCTIFEIFYKIIQFILKILLTPAAFLYKILVVCIFSRLVKKCKRGKQ